RLVTLAQGMVPMPDQLPEQFSEAIISFIDGIA
ncbi:MAG: alpha/beta hydrolase, partial [Herbaspirillum sp.]|nr:alpha/beta hydrolase [Herbaspirillum sp.]